MLFGLTPGRRGRGICLAVTVMLVAVAPATTGMAADDGGIGEFFRQQFGIGSTPAPFTYDMPEDRPLIVRPRKSRTISRRPQAKIAVGPVVPVSIYEDRTLKPGDAVMTVKGVRIFLGGHSAPYTEADFAAVADAEGLPRQVQKALVVIDKAPRG